MFARWRNFLFWLHIAVWAYTVHTHIQETAINNNEKVRSKLYAHFAQPFGKKQCARFYGHFVYSMADNVVAFCLFIPHFTDDINLLVSVFCAHSQVTAGRININCKVTIISLAIENRWKLLALFTQYKNKRNTVTITTKSY